MPYWTIWPSNTDSRGRGVVGVFEANFIEPAHDKQEFERTATLLRLEARLKQLTADYWTRHCVFIGYQPKNKSSNKGQQNSVSSSPFENLVSANVVPRGSICSSVVPPIMHVSRQPTGYNQVAGSSMACPDEHNQHIGVTSSEEKPNLKLLFGTGNGGCHTQPNGLRQNSCIFAPEDTTKKKALPLLPYSSEDYGTLEQQIGTVWSQLNIFKHGEDNKSQASAVSLPSKFVERLTEYNIQLVMRCEQYRSRKAQLNQVITRLENELMVANTKFAQLESTVDVQKKHKAECVRVKEETSN